MQALAEMWGRSGKDFATAQQNIFGDMSRRMAEVLGQQAPSGPAALFDPQGMVSATEAFTKLWASALALSQSITRTVAQGEKADPLLAELLSKLFDPRGWFSSLGGMEEALTRMAEGPRLADLWDTERKMLNVFNAWTTLRRRSIEHNTVMLEAWIRAAGSFAQTLNAKADRHETLGSWREMLALWVDTANAVLLETQRSEKYLRSQREILKASTDLRLAQQEVAAFYSEVFGYPTRAELDDVHRTVTELRRELRALERARREEPATGKARERRTQRRKPAQPTGKS
jgi:class III poly(R)-hydroxyalkanoic acid synthase PhaE subunit